MAIDTIPPWVRGPNAAEAISSGGAAGVALGRAEAEEQAASGRLAMEADRLRQSAAIEQARLQQSAEQTQMEFQARQKLAEQNQLRLQQNLKIQEAYKTAQLGIAQGRLEETKTAADQKAKQAALTFQREQAFARDVASGISVMEAYRRNPVSSALLADVERIQLREDQSKPVIREGKFPIVRIDPKTGESKVIYTPPTPTGLSAADKEDLKDLRHERDTLTKKYDDPIREKIAPPPAAEYQAYTNRIAEIQKKIEDIKRGSKTSKEPESTPSKFGHPKVGEVRGGYRFKGGDPNDQNNWEQINEGK